MSFTTLGLTERLLARVGQQGYTTPTPIQAAAIPPILEGRDVIGLAQTGTGKTAAFTLPLLQRLGAGPAGAIRALVITPTRELAEQVHGTVAELAAGSGLRHATVYGGVGMQPQERALRGGADIIVACPGRLLDHMGQGNVRLDRVQLLVLDEADRLLDMGFLPAIKRILAALPAQRQTLLFSATMSPEVASLAAHTTRDAATIQIAAARPAHTVTHAIYPVPELRKTDLLLELLHQTGSGSVLIFTRTKHRADRIAQKLERAGQPAGRLHSNRSQRQRQLALDGFRDGSVRILVATDLAARGIDVTRISHVINYDMPDTPEAYIHRIGRTGRAERTGDAFTFVTEEDLAMVRTIERTIGERIERRAHGELTDMAIAPLDAPAGPQRQAQPQRQPQPRPQHAAQARAPQRQPQRQAQPQAAQPRQQGPSTQLPGERFRQRG